MNTPGDDQFPPLAEQSLEVDLFALAELGKILLQESSLQDVMARIVSLAQQTISGADEVSLTLVTGDHANTAAATGSTAVALDERQYEQGYGPCLDAAQANETMVIKDMATELRWPRFAPLAVEAGVLSSLSVCLPIQQQALASLNYYSRSRDAFDRHSIALAHTFANYAAVALANASVYKRSAEVAAQMEQAMASRAVIEQAKGVIMQQLRCTDDQAFAVLAKRSQNANVKLRDLAAQLVQLAQSGEPFELAIEPGNG